jgi:hypothetical protein
MSLLEASVILGIPLSVEDEYVESNDFDMFFDEIGDEE